MVDHPVASADDDAGCLWCYRATRCAHNNRAVSDGHDHPVASAEHMLVLVVLQSDMLCR